MPNKPLTLKCFEELMENWRDKSDVAIYTYILPGILKADIGGVLEHELPNKTDICYALMEVNYAFNSFKQMVSYSDCPQVKAVKIYKHLINDVIELLENNAEYDVWDSIYLWIDESLKQEMPSMGYASRKSKCFADLISSLKQCFEISIQLNEREKEETNAK